MSDALLAAIATGDRDAFDDAVFALGGARPMLELLLARAPERADAEAMMPARGGRLDVAKLLAVGPAGLWAATRWALETIPVYEVRAPSPPHEQWDALVEIHKGRIEAPWLPIELLASLTAEQRSLGRRIVLGLDRRFGARARHVAALRLRLGDVPLADLLRS